MKREKRQSNRSEGQRFSTPQIHKSHYRDKNQFNATRGCRGRGYRVDNHGAARWRSGNTNCRPWGHERAVIQRPKTNEEKERLVRRLNNEISRSGEDRKLGEAVGCFRKILELGLTPTVVSYTALLNAYVRAHEIAKALELFHVMIYPSLSNHWTTPKTPLSPNIVTYTTMIKGLCNNGDLTSAWNILLDLFRSMIQESENEGNHLNSSNSNIDRPPKPLPIPNIRCINTFLRGCVRCGDVLAAWIIFALCRLFMSTRNTLVNGNNQLMDGSSAAMLIKLLCQAQQIHKAFKVMKYFKTFFKTFEPNEVMDQKSDYKDESNVEMGDKDDPEHPDFIDTENKGHSKEHTLRLPTDVFIDIGYAYALQGKLEKAKKYFQRARCRVEELLEGEKHNSFFRHRSNEQKKEIESMDHFLSIAEHTANAVGTTLSMKDFRKLFFYPPIGSRVPIDILRKAVGISTSIEEEIEPFIQLLNSYNSNVRIDGLMNLGFSVTRNVDSNDKTNEDNYITKKLNNGEKFDFKSIFGNSNSVKLEICSGSGDWIVSQCKQRENVNWIGMEIRHDRVFQIFSKGLISNAKNLCVVGGDASLIIKARFLPNCIGEVYINFPEPPPYLDHPQHLLSAPFFVALHLILKKTTKVYIVSDNIGYLKSVLGIAQSLSSFYDVPPGLTNGFPPCFEKDSSYFDRLWSNGERTSRCHLVITAT